jgi:hypothetical protein
MRHGNGHAADPFCVYQSFPKGSKGTTNKGSAEYDPQKVPSSTTVNSPFLATQKCVAACPNKLFFHFRTTKAQSSVVRMGLLSALSPEQAPTSTVN